MFPKPEKRRKPRVSGDDRAVYDAVLQRDGGCVAVGLGAQSACRGPLTREHVRPGGGAMGMRRITRVDAVVILCARHHLDGWATSHKAELREYLSRF